MTVLKVIGIIAALAVLLCLTRVGIRVQWGEMLSVTAKIACFRIRILPGKPKKPQAPKQQSAPPAAQAAPKRSFPKPTPGELRDAVCTLRQPLKRALHRTRRGVRIDPLELSVLLGGAAEPADAARLYGELHSAVWAGMPVLERLLVIPHPHIHLDVDFTAEETHSCGTVGISARIGTLLHIGMTVAIPALRWLFTYYRTKRTPVGKDDSNGNGKEKSAA